MKKSKKAAKSPRKSPRKKWVEVPAEKPILGYSRSTSELYGR